MDEDGCSYNTTPLSCMDLSNKSVIDILTAIVPNCDIGSWTPITTTWLVFFYLHVILFGISFFLLGVVSVIFLFKRHSAQRFKATTFIAIDVSLAILGFSRFLFYILDPYGVSGYCTEIGCIITSRLLFSLGFPSLTAAYTLVFLTLWHSAKMRLGRSCVQHWKVIIPLCFIHYFIAVVVEIIGAVGPQPVIFLVIGCEVFFSMWGLLVCVTFLIAGTRLLKSIHVSARNTSVVCREKNIEAPKEKRSSLKRLKSHTYSTIRMKREMKQHHKQAIRKITIITFVTASLGAIYSLFNIAQLIMVSLQIFGSCPEQGSEEYEANSDLWLALRYMCIFLELCMAILLIYSINDCRPIFKGISNVVGFFNDHCCHVKNTKTNESSTPQINNQYIYDCEQDRDTSPLNLSVISPITATNSAGNGSTLTRNLLQIKEIKDTAKESIPTNTSTLQTMSSNTSSSNSISSNNVPVDKTPLGCNTEHTTTKQELRISDEHLDFNQTERTPV